MELTQPTSLASAATPIDLHAPRAAAVIMLAVVCAVMLVFDLLLLGVMMALADGPNPVFSGFIGPMLAFTGLGLALAVYQMRLPRTAWLTSDHLGLENWFGYNAIPWDSIAYAEQTPHSFPTGKKGQGQLVLRDRAGKLLARLAGPVEVMEALHRDITRLAPAGATQPSQSPTFNKRLRRKRLTMIVTGSFLFLMGCAATWMFTREYMNERRFEREAVPGTARIVKHHMFNVTPRLDVEITTPDGKTGEKSVAMDRNAWDLLVGEQQVPVHYVPDDPNNARVPGERDTNEIPPVWMIPAGLFMALMGAGCLLLAIKGYDLISVDGKLRLIPLAESVGRGLQESPAAAHVPPPLPAEAHASAPTLQDQPAPQAVPAVHKKTPPGLRALGIFTSVYGLFGALLVLGALFLLYVSQMGNEQGGANQKGLILESVLQAFSFFFSLGLLATGFGLLRAAPWTAPTARWSAWGKILITIGLAVYGIATVNWGNVQNPSPEEMSTRRMELAMGMGAVLGCLLKLTFPLILLSLISMPQVRASLQRRSE